MTVECHLPHLFQPLCGAFALQSSFLIRFNFFLRANTFRIAQKIRRNAKAVYRHKTVMRITCVASAGRGFEFAEGRCHCLCDATGRAAGGECDQNRKMIEHSAIQIANELSPLNCLKELKEAPKQMTRYQTTTIIHSNYHYDNNDVDKA